MFLSRIAYQRWGLICSIFLIPMAVLAGVDDKPGVQGTMLLQSGEASTFALPLADFGRGPNQQDMALFQFSNLFKKQDAFVAYGWQTMDLNGVVSWDATAMYKVPLFDLAGGTVSVGTGVQRWHLPLVAHTDDYVSANTVSFDRSGRWFPIHLAADSKTVLSSNRDVAKGSFLVFTATTVTPLGKAGHYAFSLRQGPTYVHGLGMYNVSGSRAFRYEGALVVSRGPYVLELMERPQIGLQSGLKNSSYWGISVTRSFHLFGPRE